MIKNGQQRWSVPSILPVYLPTRCTRFNGEFDSTFHLFPSLDKLRVFSCFAWPFKGGKVARKIIRPCQFFQTSLIVAAAAAQQKNQGKRINKIRGVGECIFFARSVLLEPVRPPSPHAIFPELANKFLEGFLDVPTRKRRRDVTAVADTFGDPPDPSAAKDRV